MSSNNLEGTGDSTSIREFIGRYIRIAGIEKWRDPRAWASAPKTIRFRPDLLFVAILTGLVTAVVTGTVSIIQSIGAGLVMLFDMIASTASRYIELLFVPVSALEGAFTGAEMQVLEFDVAGFAVAIMVVMATYYVASKGVELLE